MRQGQVQQQREVQLQRLSPQQYLLAQLVELPLTDLEQRVRDELYENVALEEGAPDTSEDNDLAEESTSGEEGEMLTDDGLSDLSLYDTDDLPVYTSQTSSREAQAEIPIGDTRSFIEDLEAQIADYDVTPRERELIRYLIGSLDDRGFVDRPLAGIADDLLFNHNIEVSHEELSKALGTLQQFDPPGIGARNLQECLLIQIDRLLSDESDAASSADLLKLCRRIIADEFALFERNDTERLAQKLGITTDRLRQAIQTIGRLNPHPGRSLHEAADDRVQTIIPDFLIETDHESQVSFTLNQGEVPPLRVSRDYLEQLRAYQRGGESQMTRSQRDAFTYTRQKVEAAQMFVQAIQQRRHTLTVTMQAIIMFQHDFMLTQDEAQLRPLRLSDVAQHTGLNISTISRVVSSKYALLDGTLYPLKHFFLRTKANSAGQEIMKTQIYPLLQQLVDQEDKRNPLSDEQLSLLMQQHGQPISRRTVAKYRDEMDIPTALLRRRP